MPPYMYVYEECIAGTYEYLNFFLFLPMFRKSVYEHVENFSSEALFHNMYSKINNAIFRVLVRKFFKPLVSTF